MSTCWNLRLAFRVWKNYLHFTFVVKAWKNIWKHVKTCEDVWQGLLGVCPCSLLSWSHVGRRLLTPQSDTVTTQRTLCSRCVDQSVEESLTNDSMIVLTCVNHCESLQDIAGPISVVLLSMALLISAHLCVKLPRGLSTLLHAIHGSTFVLARTPARFLAKHP